MNNIPFLLLSLSLFITACMSKSDSSVKDDEPTQQHENTSNEIDSTATTVTSDFLVAFHAKQAILNSNDILYATKDGDWQMNGLSPDDVPHLESSNLEEIQQEMLKQATIFQNSFLNQTALPTDFITTPMNLVIHRDESTYSDEETDELKEYLYTVKVENTTAFEKVLKAASTIDPKSPDEMLNRGFSAPVEIKDNVVIYYKHLTGHNTQYIENIAFSIIDNKPVLNKIILQHTW